MNTVEEIKNSFLIVEDGIIKDFGEMKDLKKTENTQYIDLKNKDSLMPALIDSHTHLVFAEGREKEFEDKINGLSYEEIAARGGGILNSAEKLRVSSEDQLFEDAIERLEMIKQTGTGAVEIKSGYGLSTESELKMLRVIKRLKKQSNIPIKASFLGAHAFPKEFLHNKDEYVDLIIEEMLPKVMAEDLADYIDVFCEKDYFNLKQTERILDSAHHFGLRAKIHVNQFYDIGGIELALKYNALSVDHLEVLSPENIQNLKNSECIPVALPACSFFTHLDYTPARQIIDNGLPLCLASDFNPGSAPTSNLFFIWSLACIQMKMSPQEAFNALTLNAAYALEMEKEMGSIERGKKAIFLKLNNTNKLSSLPYYVAMPPPIELLIH